MKKNNSGCLGFIGDEILPSSMEIIISHENKDPLLNNLDDSWTVRDPVFFFFVAHSGGRCLVALVTWRIIQVVQGARTQRIHPYAENTWVYMVISPYLIPTYRGYNSTYSWYL